MFDYQHAFVPTALACAAGAEALKGDVYDSASTSTKEFEGYPQRAPKLFCSGKVTGAAATVRCRLVAASDAALTADLVTIADTGTSPSIADGDNFHFEVPAMGQSSARRYYGVLVTVTGVGATATLVAGVKQAPQNNMPYKKAAVP